MSKVKGHLRGTKLQIYVGFDPDQVEQLKAHAERKRSTVPQVVREAVDLFLSQNTNDIGTSDVDKAA